MFILFPADGGAENRKVQGGTSAAVPPIGIEVDALALHPPYTALISLRIHQKRFQQATKRLGNTQQILLDCRI
ncbi:MAG: hypothetical protein ABFD50_11330 [Smithella sp.]